MDSPFISIWFAGSLAEDATHLADLLHGRFQVLHHVVLHFVTSKVVMVIFISDGLQKAWVNFSLWYAGLFASPQREGIIAREYRGNKWQN